MCLGSFGFQLLYLVSVSGTKSQRLFVAPETLSELTEGLMFSDCGRMSLQLLRVVVVVVGCEWVGGGDSCLTKQRKGVQGIEISNAPKAFEPQNLAHACTATLGS